MSNMELKDRIKEIRKGQKKSQAAFGADLGCSRDAIANYEGGRAEPPETFIQLLCAKFHVREHWLRTGEGERDAGDDEALFEKIRERFRLRGLSETIARAWFRLPEEEREHIAKEVEDIAKRIKSGMPEDGAQEDPQRIDIDQEVEDYRAELEAQEKGRCPAAGTSATEKRA